MKPLVIFGTGRLAEVALHHFTHDSEYRVMGFTVDGDPPESRFHDRPLVPFAEVTRHFPPTEHAMFVAIGYREMNSRRAAKCRESRERGYPLAAYLSSESRRPDFPPLGANTFILDRNTVQPYVQLGEDVTIWSGNHIGHHTRIGDHVFITSRVCIGGGAEIGASCFIGMGAIIRDGIRLGERTLVGAGALILHDTAPGSVYSVRGTSARDLTSDQVRL